MLSISDMTVFCIRDGTFRGTDVRTMVAVYLHNCFNVINLLLIII